MAIDLLDKKRRLWVRFQPDPSNAPFDVVYETEMGTHLSYNYETLSVYDYDANVQAVFTGVVGAWFSDFLQEAAPESPE